MAGLQCINAEYRHLHSGGECGVASFSKANAGVLAEEWNRRHGLKGNRTAGRELAANPQNLHALRIRRRLPPRLHGRATLWKQAGFLPPAATGTSQGSIRWDHSGREVNCKTCGFKYVIP
ncbi:MAG: hypothetical protein OXD45_04540 [Rhodobacteraceae bacterium]|nr:hypothetical protein [Paracoccaceae bacterium]